MTVTVHCRTYRGAEAQQAWLLLLPVLSVVRPNMSNLMEIEKRKRKRERIVARRFCDNLQFV
jgi:hypothetical protein